MFQAINPATGQPSESIPDLAAEDLERSIDQAQRAFEAWSRQPIDQRAEVLRKAADIMRSGTDEYAATITREMGKRILEARFEIGLSASILDYYARNAAEFLRSSPLPEVENAELRFEPLGIILAIEPWNFPFYQVARVAGPQLAAGNVLLVKHADIVPECALLLAGHFQARRCSRRCLHQPVCQHSPDRSDHRRRSSARGHVDRQRASRCSGRRTCGSLPQEICSRTGR